MQKSPEARYIHGSTPEEQHRLSLLNTILNDNCIQALAPVTENRILDVGSGLGQFTRRIAREAPPGAFVLGIERDQAQLQAARRLAVEAGESELVNFRPGDAYHLPLTESERQSFDLVHTRFLLEHVSHPHRVIEQMALALRPGGRLVVADDDHANFRLHPEPPGFSYLWEAYLRSYERLGNDPYIGRRLVSLLHAADLTSIRSTVVFFGGCAGQPTFPAVADNLIGILRGARTHILDEHLLEERSFNQALDGLRWWRALPDAALWYGVCWAEARGK